MTTPTTRPFAGVVCDLDGVVYRGPVAVAHAVETLSALSRPVVYATNNASRTPAEVASHLVDLGLSVDERDVATSSQAAAWVLASQVAPRATVLAVGGAGVAHALREHGLRPVSPHSGPGRPEVTAVVQGYGSAVTAAELAEAAYSVQGGAIWVATNTDLTLPTDRGTAPGNGSLVGAVANAVGRPPDVVAGKPAAPLYRMCADRLGLPAPDVLAVGDRLDTDIEGAVAAGMDSLLVLTGVDDLDAALDAPQQRRPTWVAPDLRVLAGLVGGAPDSGVVALRTCVDAVYRAVDAGADADVLAGLRTRAWEVLAALGPR